MKVFTIDNENHIVAHASPEAAQTAKLSDACLFTTEDEFNLLTNDWAGGRLVAVWNALPGALPIRKFTDRKTALR